MTLQAVSPDRYQSPKKMARAKYPHNDQIKALLKGCAAHVERDGLNYLIPTWQRFADVYADREDFIYEWLNDLDTRDIIEDILEILPEKERSEIESELKTIDSKVLEKTFEINECVCGYKREKENKYNRHKNWYYYRMNQKIFENEEGDFTKR